MGHPTSDDDPGSHTTGTRRPTYDPGSPIPTPSALPPDGTKITIVLNLPMGIDRVSAVLKAVGEQWPGVTIDMKNLDGWLIEVPADTPDQSAPQPD